MAMYESISDSSKGPDTVPREASAGMPRWADRSAATLKPTTTAPVVFKNSRRPTSDWMSLERSLSFMGPSLSALREEQELIRRIVIYLGLEVQTSRGRLRHFDVHDFL